MSEGTPLRSAVADPVRTDHGARTELRLDAVTEGGAHYEARWFLGARGKAEPGDAATLDNGVEPGDAATPDAHGIATVSPNGEVDLRIQGGQIPDWLSSFTEKLLRTTARSVQGGRYPRRLTRWRDGPG